MRSRGIVGWSAPGEFERWSPTTLDQLGKSEEFLEDVLASSPELLLLESRRTGIRGPFKIFRQTSMRTPSGRRISPDIVILAASGHVIVVEVKLSVNPELKDRAVIAQIVDYASSFAALTEPQCVELFGTAETSTWTDCVEQFFPGDAAPDELAEVLFERMQRGELNLVIACDKVPAGLPDVVAGIATQSALGFELDLLEVVPYVSEISETGKILFVPSTRLATEIVSRTAVTVTYREGDSKPSTKVETTSIDNIEAGLKSAKRGAPRQAKRAERTEWCIKIIRELRKPESKHGLSKFELRAILKPKQSVSNPEGDFVGALFRLPDLGLVDIVRRGNEKVFVLTEKGHTAVEVDGVKF